MARADEVVVEGAVEVEEEERGRDLDLSHTRSVYQRYAHHTHKLLPISTCSRARKPISTANYRSNCLFAHLDHFTSGAISSQPTVTSTLIYPPPRSPSNIAIALPTSGGGPAVAKRQLVFGTSLH